MTIVAEAGAQPTQHLANKAPVLRIINREALVKPLQEVKAVPEESESKNSSSSSDEQSNSLGNTTSLQNKSVSQNNAAESFSLLKPSVINSNSQATIQSRPPSMLGRQRFTFEHRPQHFFSQNATASKNKQNYCQKK